MNELILRGGPKDGLIWSRPDGAEALGRWLVFAERDTDGNLLRYEWTAELDQGRSVWVYAPRKLEADWQPSEQIMWGRSYIVERYGTRQVR